MAVPKKKKSKSKIGMRRSHDHLTPANLTTCSNAACEEQILPHRICPACGQYKGRNYYKVVEKKKEAK